MLLLEPLPGTPTEIERGVKRLGLEGVVAKWSDSRYQPGERAGAWVKVKFQPSRDFVTGGSLPDGQRVESRIVGVYDGGRLVATGSVQTVSPRRCATINEGLLRHTRYVDLRPDVKASTVRRATTIKARRKLGDTRTAATPIR